MFVAFTGGYLQALVKKPGRYDAKADVRGGTEIAVLDVLSGKTGPGRRTSPTSRKFLRFAEKRAEKPGLEAFVRVGRRRRAGWSWSARARSYARWRCRRSSRSTRRASLQQQASAAASSSR